MSIDHVFIDLDLAVKTIGTKKECEGYRLRGVALVRTTDRGKVLAATAASGDFVQICDAIDSMVKPFSASYIVVASQADRKRVALRDACEDASEPDPFKGRAWLDFGQVAWPLALADLVPNRSLETLGAHFNVRRSHPGTLTGDCAYLTEVYWAMARSYRMALKVEGEARKRASKLAGGHVVESFRRFVGI